MALQVVVKSAANLPNVKRFSKRQSSCFNVSQQDDPGIVLLT